ncbi:MAG: Rieske (2Fe-2S) protein [Nitrospina sp.]|nr:MAG: Rieske (2Fe-2S) protein [Nitrospina sp.]
MDFQTLLRNQIMALHQICKISDIGEGQCKTFTVDSKQIAVYNAGGQWCATENTCLHKGGSLGSGKLEGNIITCPLHGWQYDVTSGQCQNNPEAKVGTYKVQVEGDQVSLEI